MIYRICVFILFFSSSSFAQPISLTTVGEQSGYLQTGRYSEVEALCKAFEKAYPKNVDCLNFGTTPQGRPMLALVAFDGSRVRRPVLLAQGGIHAGEIDGKDAGFRVMRDLLNGKLLPGVLSKLTFVFVPVFNVDGHERFGKWNRPNQNGPIEMGFRTTAQNLNLNRDYVKADAPEMKAMLGLLERFDPIVYADLHVTDGADFQHDISITVEPIFSQDDALQKIGKDLQASVIADLQRSGAKAVDFYPSLRVQDDPTSGFSVSVTPPRFSNSYWATRGRIGVLVETHSWKDYKTRVQRTYDAASSLLKETASKAQQWTSIVKEVEKRDSMLAGKSVSLDYDTGEHHTLIDFLGYKYSISASPISNSKKIQYNRSQPAVWRIPLYDTVVALLSVIAPREGYLIPAEWANKVSPSLKLHGIQYQTLSGEQEFEGARFRATKWKWAPRSNEGRMPLTVEGDFEPFKTKAAKGALFVPIAQPRARLAMALLEPKAPDSLLAWGEFNAVFEQKEYMEAYVAETVAEDMLSKDTKLKQEFEAKLANDPAFAADPGARLDFFYKRHASWDTNLGVYPILRVESSLSKARMTNK